MTVVGGGGERERKEVGRERGDLVLEHVFPHSGICVCCVTVVGGGGEREREIKEWGREKEGEEVHERKRER